MTTITDYTTLQASIADFLNRKDLTDSICTFIQLAETQMQRRLRVLDGERATTITFPVQSNRAPMPADFKRMRFFDAEYEPLDVLLERAPLIDTRPIYDPRFFDRENRIVRYSLTGNEMVLWPCPTGEDPVTFEMVYDAGFEPLSDTSPTNWLLEENPDVYLYGALLQSAPYLKNDARISVWGEFFLTGISDMNSFSDDRIAERLTPIPSGAVV